MPFVRFLVSKHYTYIITLILLLGKIMFIYSYSTKKKLIYIVIITPFSYQPFFYLECTKFNIYLSYNI